jgi:DNA modification methylase
VADVVGLAAEGLAKRKPMATDADDIRMSDDIRIIHGDCLEVMAGMEAGSVDAIVTDPPWMDYETGRYDASAHHSAIGYVPPERYAAHFFRVLRDDSACVLWCRWDCFEAHAEALTVAGFSVRNCIVWGKPNHTAGDLDGNLGNQHETAVFAAKGAWKRHGPRETNLWLERHLFSRAKRDHPSEKPIGLMKRSVELACPRDGVVLDPFAGSGTTAVACMKSGRRCIAIELDARYIPIINRRLDRAATPLFPAAS